jgi:nucleoside-diphosphate-sugar epimerase
LKTLVITGSSGYVGEHLALTAIELGYEVIGIDREKSTNLPCVQFTVDLAFENIAHLIPRGATVIHLASLSSDSLCRENPVLAIDANLKATALIVLASEESSAEQIVFASSEWVYPENTELIDQVETDSLDLTDLNSLYAISKLVGESIIRTTSKAPYSLLRFGIVYGPRLKPGSSAENLALKVYNNEEVRVGSIMTSRRFIYIDDLIEAILKVVAFGPVSNGGIALNIAGPEIISFSKIVETSNIILGKSVAIIDGGNPPSIRNPLINRAYLLIDWQPRVEFSTGIRNCLKSMTNSAN